MKQKYGVLIGCVKYLTYQEHHTTNGSTKKYPGKN